MCGIVGYVGKRQAAPILLEGLRQLEYRGYDSAGLAVVPDGQILDKRQGRIDSGLARLLEREPLPGNFGIGHTRWATHGPPWDENSHPHQDQSGTIAVVHNGVIENFEALRQRFFAAGHTFKSSTDTEVLAHLIGDHYARLAAAPPGARAACPSAEPERSDEFWRYAPMTATGLGTFLALQGLWAVPWLMQVGGHTREVAAFHMLLTTLAMVCGFWVQPSSSARCAGAGWRRAG